MRLIEYFSRFDRVPAVPILGYPALVPLGLTSSSCLLEPSEHAKVVEYIVREFDVDASLPLLDLTVEAEALGAKVEYRDIDAPQIGKIVNADYILQKENPVRMPIMVKAAKKIKGLSKDLPTGFYVTGPFTIVGQVIGIMNLFKLISTGPRTLPPILDAATETVSEYARQLEEAGVDFIVIAEPSSSLISVIQFKEFSEPYLEKLIRSTHIDMVLHICGRSRHLLSEMDKTGAAGISIDQNIPMEYAVSIMPEDIMVFGNYSPVNLMQEDPSTIKANVFKMLSNIGDRRNAVSSTGCDIPSRTPAENIKAFIEASKSIRRS
ncbi:MAG: uroporphyrinogen decarboxylase family protein [Nitrososphaeria archaeon]